VEALISFFSTAEQVENENINITNIVTLIIEIILKIYAKII